MADLLLSYAGAATYMPQLVRRLERAGAEVGWEPPTLPDWDIGGQTEVEAELAVQGDAARIARAVSRFRDYYPKARIHVV